MAGSPGATGGFASFPASVLAVALLVAVLMGAAPRIAFAYYNQVNTEGSAQQEIGTYGDLMTADQIPDGTYSITARTSSHMCVLYANQADAADRKPEGKETATIEVKNGVIRAQFYLSAAYSRMYLGTAEEAAALTNVDGTDDSAYLAGTPADGYKPHLYTLEIPALNYEFTMATFNGGNGVEKGEWFTRTVVFKPSAEVNAAIEKADKAAEEEASKAASGTDAADGKSSSSASSAGETDDSTPGSANDGGEPEGEEPAGPQSAPTGGTAATGGGATGAAGAEGTAGTSGSVSASSAEPAGTGGGKRGVRISGAEPLMPTAFADDAESVAVVEQPEGIPLAQVLAIAAVVIAVAGVLLRAVPFMIARRAKK